MSNAMIKTVAQGTVELGKKTHAGLLGFLISIVFSTAFIGLLYYFERFITAEDQLRYVVAWVVSVILFWALFSLVVFVLRGEKCWKLAFEGMLESYEHIINGDQEKTIIRLTEGPARMIDGFHELPDPSGVLIRVLRNEADAYQVEI